MVSAGGGELLLLHWNVHSWRDAAGRPNLDAVAALIDGRGPDVVSLVEVSEPWAAAVSLPELARRGGYTWIFVPSVEPGPSGEPGRPVEPGRDGPARGYGNALLTRLPVRAVQQWQLTWPPAVYDGTEPSETRSVALARVALPGGGAAWVGSTHLPSRDRQARAAALRRLTTLTRGLEPPWVICGDFNTAPSRWIKRGEPVVTGPRPARPTFPARFPYRSLDYCIASPGVSVRARPLYTAGSDHLPLLVRCRVPARDRLSLAKGTTARAWPRVAATSCGNEA
jgi:endonuclease/exonuclease/phosphatase family metal-dependent hydrolase